MPGLDGEDGDKGVMGKEGPKVRSMCLSTSVCSSAKRGNSLNLNTNLLDTYYACFRVNKVLWENQVHVEKKVLKGVGVSKELRVFQDPKDLMVMLGAR